MTARKVYGIARTALNLHVGSDFLRLVPGTVPEDRQAGLA